MFTLRLASSHHSFSLGRRVFTRSAEAFYQLQVTQHLRSSLAFMADVSSVALYQPPARILEILPPQRRN